MDEVLGRYIMAEKWDRKKVADRLYEAASTLRNLRVPGVRPLEYGSNWPDVIHDMMDAYGWHEAELKPPIPTAETIDRMDEALGWLRWLEPDQVRLVWLYAEGTPRKMIMAKLGVSRTSVWILWTAAVKVITTRLNVGETNQKSPRRLKTRKKR